MIGFLSEFWDAITSATEGTVEWFQSLGNAVAGALGNLLFYPLQAVIDFGLAFAYLFARLLEIIGYLFAPFTFLFYFLKSFIAALFVPASVSELLPNSDALQAFFTSLPLFSTLMAVLTAAFWSLIIFRTLRILRH